MEATCRGCYALGTACNKCSRCVAELKEMLVEADGYLSGFDGMLSKYKKVEDLRQRIRQLSKKR